MSTQCFTLDSVPWITNPEAVAAERNFPGENLSTRLLADTNFFKGKSIEELAREQGVGTMKDIRVFAGGVPEDQGVDEMLAQLEAMRGSSSDRDDSIRARLADVDRQEEKRHRLQAFLERETPAWDPGDHPEIDAAGGAAAWVRKLRSEAEQGFERRTGKQEKE